MSFDRKSDLKLIKLVEDLPLLYNTRHKHYLESDLRDEAWQKIAAELERPAKRCKTRWIGMRDNMRRKLKEREKNKDGPMFHYKYERELGFLIPFYKSFQDQETVENEEYLHEDDAAVESDQIFLNDVYDVTQSEIKPNISTFIDVSTRPLDPLPPPSQEKSDPISIFLEAVGSTLKNLNPYYLNQAKSKIFQVVQDCELQQIINKGEHPVNEH